MQMNRNAPTTSGAADEGSEVDTSSFIGSKLLAIAVTPTPAALASAPAEPVGGGVGVGVGVFGEGEAGGSTTAGAAPLLPPDPPPQDAVTRAKADTKTNWRIGFLGHKNHAAISDYSGSRFGSRRGGERR
eukprot:Opistho-2@2503